jgi:hypothetical protein
VCPAYGPMPIDNSIIPRSANRPGFEPVCLDSLTRSWNGLNGWELWKRVSQHKAKAQDTLPYLASASHYAGAFSCGYPAPDCSAVHKLQC